MRAFFDSVTDGIGDFGGLTQKLDYLEDLGVTAVWLLPFCPSPLRDDGYDISDYTDVHPSYGTLKDFQRFLREAHRRGLRVITELVLNHTSDQHVWFQRSRRAAPGSRWRNFYVWSDTPGEVPRRAHHLQGFRDLQLDLGPDRQGLLLASLLLAPARPELGQSRGPRGHVRRHGLLVRPGRRWPAAGRCAVSLRARGHQLREPAGDASGAARAAQARGREVSRPHAAGRSQSVAGGRGRLLRQGRRMPHGVSLPA